LFAKQVISAIVNQNQSKAVKVSSAAAKYGRYMPVRRFIDENIAKKPDLRYNKFFGKVA